MSREHNFKEGDIVQVKYYVGNNDMTNQIGIVRYIDDGEHIGVEFFTDIRGHDLDGKLINESRWRGWYSHYEKVVHYNGDVTQLYFEGRISDKDYMRYNEGR